MCEQDMIGGVDMLPVSARTLWLANGEEGLGACGPTLMCELRLLILAPKVEDEGEVGLDDLRVTLPPAGADTWPW